MVASEESLLAVLHSDPFLELLRRRAEITLRLLQRLAVSVRRGNERVMELSTLEATNRIYAELLRLAEPDATADELADASADLVALSDLFENHLLGSAGRKNDLHRCGDRFEAAPGNFQLMGS